MDGANLVSQIVQIIVSGITEMGKGIGAGISNVVQQMAFTTTGTGESATTTLSVWFIVVLAFAGISLAVGLTRLVYTFLTTLGK